MLDLVVGRGRMDAVEEWPRKGCYKLDLEALRHRKAALGVEVYPYPRQKLV